MNALVDSSPYVARRERLFASLGDDIASTLVERAHPVELLEQLGVAAAGHGGPDGLGIRAQRADVDHGHEASAAPLPRPGAFPSP